MGFLRFERDPAAMLPTDLAVLMVGVAARQAASPTARAAARAAIRPDAPCLFAPAHGAFNRAVAAALTAWQAE